MTFKASGRSAMMLAMGLFVCFAGPSHATAGADNAAATAKSENAGVPVTMHKYARLGTHHWKKYAHRKSGKVAQRSDSDSAADAANGDDRSALTPSVANANAQLAAADKPAGNVAKAMSARASDIIQAPPAQPAAADQFVAADQLNDVDRALRETPPASAPAAATLTMAAAETPGAPAAAAASAGSDNSTWDQTSLIGKIFIGFGTLLTMASAARMFMA